MDEEYKEFLSKKLNLNTPPTPPPPQPPPRTDPSPYLWFAFGIFFLLTLLYVFGAFTTTPPTSTVTAPTPWRVITVNGTATIDVPPYTCVNVAPNFFKISAAEGTNANTSRATITGNGEARIYIYRKGDPDFSQCVLKATDAVTSRIQTITTKRTTITIPTNYCLHFGKGDTAVRIIDRDQQGRDLYAVTVVSKTGAPVELEVLLYPMAHEQCAAFR